MRGKRICFGLVCLIFVCAAVAQATIFGTVRGVVHDPQHRPVQDASVTLRAEDSDWTQNQKSDENGEFQFATVPVGRYTLSVQLEGFEPQEQTIIVESNTSPILHFQLSLAGVSSSAVVTANASGEASTDTVTPITLVSRADIQNTPGADRTDSLAIITDNVPGAYMVHDMLHIRGGHQFSWLIDGVPVPNTNIASNVGPQIDPKDLDYVEVQRGAYDAAYGDRTYGIFNAVPRTGFERDRECELVLSYGNYNQTNDQINCGSHTERLAYYGSFSGNRSDLGLETPVAQIIHDAANGYSGFGSLIYNVNPKNQLRLVASVRQDFFQIPIAPGLETQPDPYHPESVVITPSDPIQSDVQREGDRFVTFSWVRTLSHNGLLTLSPFYHFNSANYDGSPSDIPNSVTDLRASNYAGGQATFSATVARNTIEAGFYGFWQHDNQLFNVLFHDGSGNAPLLDREIANGNLEAIWVADKYAVTSWLTLIGGLRQSHFASPNVGESPTSPRAGVTIRVPRTNVVFRGFYGQFYQAPPLVTITGPLLGIVNTPGDQANPQQFIPLLGERDTEYQAGVTVPFKGWLVDADAFHTLSHDFLDHGNINYDVNGTIFPTNIFLPLTTQEALIRGYELTLRSPLLWRRVQVRLAYSNQTALFTGAVTGGLNNFAAPQVGWAPLDHDQRNTLNVGFDVKLPWRATLAGNVYYGSGFASGVFDPTLVPLPPRYLAGHATLDLSVAKSFGERFSASANFLNVTDSHLLIDDSVTFGGFHYDDPFEVYGEFRYNFHY
jgi:hypothetical protein